MASHGTCTICYGIGMTLTLEQDLAEHELRMTQMIVNIDKMRRDIRNETWKIMISGIVAAAALLAAGAALGNYFTLHSIPAAQTAPQKPV